jgi:hypothetical protein
MTWHGGSNPIYQRRQVNPISYFGGHLSHSRRPK